MSTSINGVMLQGFHWFLKPNFPESHNRSLWQFLRDEADHFRTIGIDAIWLPPAYKAAFKRSNSVGYDVYDHFDLGEFTPPEEVTTKTKYGTKSELVDAIHALHGNGHQKWIQVYADVVLNHKMGGEKDNYWQAIRVEKNNRNSERWGEGFERGMIEIKAYTKFDHSERRGKYSSFQWRAKHFDSVDTAAEIRQNDRVFHDPKDKYIYRFLHNELGYRPADKSFDSWVSTEKGNDDYLTGCDFDYGRYDVREEMKYWGAWFAKELALDGVRLDAVKHISADYIREWLGHVRSDSGFVVVRQRYTLYGDKAEGLWTDSQGWADFLADGGTVSLWIEDGVGLEG